MSVFVTGPVRVRVPATSANLGPGFDALGLALTLYDDLEAEATSSGLEIEVSGEGAGSVARDDAHLVVRAMHAAFTRVGERPAGLVLRCANAVPHGRGLGSSAAAVVAGVLLARALVPDGAQRLDDTAVLGLAHEFEGHPDNVAPCLLGGLTVAWTVDGAPRAVRRDVDPAVVPVALVPAHESSTEHTRSLLPASVPFADAAYNAARSALLVAALTGTPQALLDATDERLHQQYRAAAMPQSAALVRELRGAGHAAVISGAGPSVLVLARGELEAEQVRAAVPSGWTVPPLAVDARGAHMLPAGVGT